MSVTLKSRQIPPRVNPPRSAIQSLDQQRAGLAWKYCSGQKAKCAEFKDYRNLVKGAPALIMNSGLIATLAFYRGKKGVHERLRVDLLSALRDRGCWPDTKGDDAAFDKKLLDATGLEYQAISREALELLKWFRQFVDALAAGG